MPLMKLYCPGDLKDIPGKKESLNECQGCKLAPKLPTKNCLFYKVHITIIRLFCLLFNYCKVKNFDNVQIIYALKTNLSVKVNVTTWQP